MYKNEFLTELRNRLQGLPQDDLDNRINFYEEMINDRMDEGKSEEEAVAEIGSVEEVVTQIASETPLLKLVKEKAKPKRALKVWEIILIILGFPLWFPLLITAFVLCLVAYILIWTLVIVVYSVELSFIVSSLAGLVVFFAYLFAGQFNLIPLAVAVMSAGGGVLLYFGCTEVTKLTIKLSKNIVLKIKTAFIRKGKNK